MSKWSALIGLTLTINLLAAAGMAQEGTAKSPTLTTEDRAEIQQLVASYARALGTCKPEEYAGLFESRDGFFESQSRGKVAGREILIALVRSEPACINSGANSGTGPRNVPTPIIEVSPLGVTAKVPLGTGRYEDVYVKTEAGWRFRSRNNMSKEALELGFTFQDFAQIRQLVGEHGQFEDVYIKSPQGLLYRSGGMTIEPTSPREAKGKIHLKDDDGRYEDVYVKTLKGWRFNSRTYVPTDEVAPFNRDSRPQR